MSEFKEVIVERFAYSPFGVFGRLSVGAYECYTVERPWRDNKADVSCITAGDYDLSLGVFHHGNYPAYEVMNVTGRSEIKIHVGNTMDDVRGCIAVGESLGYMEGKWAVGNSKKAFEDFMNAMGDVPSAKIKIVRWGDRKNEGGNV